MAWSSESGVLNRHVLNVTYGHVSGHFGSRALLSKNLLILATKTSTTGCQRVIFDSMRTTSRQRLRPRELKEGTIKSRTSEMIRHPPTSLAEAKAWR